MDVVLWYRDETGAVFPAHPDSAVGAGLEPFGVGVLDDVGAMIARELLDAQIGDEPDELAQALAAWRRAHPVPD